MIKVITYLGAQQVQDGIYKKAKGYGIEFVCEDCENPIMMLSMIEQYKDLTDVIIVNNSILHSQDIESLLCEIRKVSKNIRIILILNGKRSQYIPKQLEEYKSTYCLFDIIFENNGIDTNMLISVMQKGKLTENELIINNPKMYDKEKFVIGKNVDEHICNTIAIFGTTHGAGVSSMVITLAEYFALAGNVTKAVDLTGTSALSFAKKGKAIYLTEKRQDLEEIKSTSEFVIYDFGVPFDISPKGDLLSVNKDYTPAMITELKCCELKVAMGFLGECQLNKVKYFWNDRTWMKLIGNDYVFLFDDEPRKVIKGYDHINMLSRNDMAFADAVTKVFMRE